MTEEQKITEERAIQMNRWLDRQEQKANTDSKLAAVATFRSILNNKAGNKTSGKVAPSFHPSP